MSHNDEDTNDWRAALMHPATLAALRIGKMVARGLLLFAICFVEIVAELLAPVVLICGIGWAALPAVLSMVSLEGQGREMLNTVLQSVPREIHLGHTVLTPTGLIMDGLLLIALVAVCRTVQTILSMEAG